MAQANSMWASGCLCAIIMVTLGVVGTYVTPYSKIHTYIELIQLLITPYWCYLSDGRLVLDKVHYQSKILAIFYHQNEVIYEHFSVLLSNILVRPLCYDLSALRLHTYIYLHINPSPHKVTNIYIYILTILHINHILLHYIFQFFNR